MEDQILQYTLRVDQTLFQKFRYITESNDRSINKELERCLREHVALYENRYGEIPLDEGAQNAD